MKRTDTKTLIEACRILARDIQSDDGVANAALAEIADRMEELEKDRERLRAALKKGVALVSLENGWGTWRVMESAELYLNAAKFEEEANAAMEGTE